MGVGEWFKAVSTANSFKKILNKKKREIDIFMRRMLSKQVFCLCLFLRENKQHVCMLFEELMFEEVGELLEQCA